MNILFIASECVPFAKTGGLADVVGALPKYLKALGHEVIVVIPKYASINTAKFGIAWAHGPMGVWMGDRQEWCSVHRAERDGVSIFSSSTMVTLAAAVYITMPSSTIISTTRVVLASSRARLSILQRCWLQARYCSRA